MKKALVLAVLASFWLVQVVLPCSVAAMPQISPVIDGSGVGVQVSWTFYTDWRNKLRSSPSSALPRGLYAHDSSGVVAPARGSVVDHRAEVDPEFKGSINQNTNYQEATSPWAYVGAGGAFGLGVVLAAVLGKKGSKNTINILPPTCPTCPPGTPPGNPIPNPPKPPPPVPPGNHPPEPKP